METFNQVWTWYTMLPFSQQALFAGLFVGGTVTAGRLIRDPDLLMELLNILAFPFELTLSALMDIVGMIIPGVDGPTDRLWDNATGNNWDDNGPINIGGR